MPEKPDILIPRGERIVLDAHPSPLTIPLWHHGILAGCLAVAAIVWLVERGLGINSGASQVLLGWVRISLAVLVWLIYATLDVGLRRYVVTESRLVLRMGILSRTVVDLPLRRVQHSAFSQGPVQRMLGLGDVFVSSAGVDAPAMVFAGIGRPAAVLDAIRVARDEAERRESAPTRRMPVIGLVGGIGSGKSTVARIFSELGCVVIDSDKAAHDALAGADVRATLVDWWGKDVLTPQGEVDRRAVGRIVFSDPAQRSRLEQLIHPIVKAGRAEVIAQARKAGRPGVVIDAPLLFEAGSDAECDEVVFVDAPAHAREARVRARAWSGDELARREAAQIPLAEKRSRSSVVIPNEGSVEDLRNSVAIAWGTILERAQQRETPGR